MRRRNHDSPPSQWAGLVPAALTASVIFLAILPATRAITDPDIFFHLRIGEWITEHQALPNPEPFSQLGIEEQKPWYAYSWLFEVMMHGLYSVAGWTGIMLYAVVTSGLIAASLLGLLLRFEPRRPVAVALTGLALLAMWPLFTVRPWLITILFFILELRILLGVRETGNWKRFLWLIPLFALWANIHIQFVYGLFVIAFFAVEPLVGPVLRWIGSGKDRASLEQQEAIPVLVGLNPRRTPPVWWYLLAGLIACLACLANPYGWHLGRVVLEYATQSAPLRGVLELTSPEFRSLPEWIAAGLLLAAILFWAIRDFRSPLPIILLLIGAILFFRMRRDIWFLAVSASLVLAMCRVGLSKAQMFHEAAEPAAISPGESALKLWGWRYRLILIPILFGMMGLSGNWKGLRPSWHTEAISRRYPVAAAEFVRGALAGSDGQTRVQGPLFNSFDWGGYLIWALPELPVSMDGRTNLYGSERIQRNWDTWDGKEGWMEDPALIKAGVIIADPEAPLSSLLFSSPGFERIFQDPGDDPVCAVFVKTESPGSPADSVGTESVD